MIDLSVTTPSKIKTRMVQHYFHKSWVFTFNSFLRRPLTTTPLPPPSSLTLNSGRKDGRGGGDYSSPSCLLGKLAAYTWTLPPWVTNGQKKKTKDNYYEKFIGNSIIRVKLERDKGLNNCISLSLWPCADSQLKSANDVGCIITAK